MPGDELQELRRRLGNEPGACGCSLDEVCAGIVQQWAVAGFSDIRDETLRRYYSWHLEKLSGLSSLKPPDSAFQPCLLGLIDALLANYSAYCNLNISAPPVFAARAMERLIPDTAGEGPMAAWLAQKLPELLVGASFFRIRYLQELASRINQAEFSDRELLDILVAYNFNHLGLYSLAISWMKELPAPGLRGRLAELAALPVRQGYGYDPEWPSLKDMLCGWLKEEAALRCEQLAHPVPKLFLNTSVTHLALLIRLLQEEGLTAAATLAELFGQVSAAIRTKKQPLISEGSLSNAYYGTDLHTAARVRDLLQRMLSRLNRKYFPVLAAFAAGTALACFPGN